MSVVLRFFLAVAVLWFVEPVGSLACPGSCSSIFFFGCCVVPLLGSGAVPVDGVVGDLLVQWRGAEFVSVAERLLRPATWIHRSRSTDRASPCPHGFALVKI